MSERGIEWRDKNENENLRQKKSKLDNLLLLFFHGTGYAEKLERERKGIYKFKFK